MTTEEITYEVKDEHKMEGCSHSLTGMASHATDKHSSVIDDGQPMEEINEKFENGTQEDSQPTSLLYSGDNVEEYLKETWQRLGVGEDGYLSLAELATVCHAIGMEKVANEVLEQLFSRLDVDGDGRISFEEFVHMFQNLAPSGDTSLILDESQHQEVPDAPLSRMSSVSDDRRGVASLESGVFSTIDPENTGYASVERVLELWESLRIGNGAALLKELGFTNRPHERLSLRDLSTAMEEEFLMAEDQSPITVTTTQMAVLTYIQEVKFIRISLDSARGERNKLRFDLNEANQRLGLLAQELDDQSAHMEASSQHQIHELERQYRDQVRELQEAISHERDTARDQVAAVIKELQTQNSNLLEEDSKLKAKLNTLQADIKRVEIENLELSEKLQEAEKQINQMERQLVDLQELRKKVAEYESISPREDEYKRVLDRLERVTAENQQLRDNNDELLSQINVFPVRQNNVKSSDKDSLDGSCMGDYVGLLAPVKRRGSSSGSGDDSCEEESPRGIKVRRCSKGLNVHYVDVGSYDESFLDTSISSLLKGANVSGLQNIDTSQPPSLDDLHSKVARKYSTQSDGNDGSINKDNAHFITKNAPSQLLNKELKQVFNQVRASVKEEYRKEGVDFDPEKSYEGDSKRQKRISPEELEAEISKLQNERDRLLKEISIHKEEFAHQLEQKEQFEVEEAVSQCSDVKIRLEKLTSQLDNTGTDAASKIHLSSTPVKLSCSSPSTLKDKSQLLNMALDELEMALKREEQERNQRINIEALLASRQGSERRGSSCDSLGTETTTTTTYPLSGSEPSTTSKVKEQGIVRSPTGEGRVRVLEEHCRGLEGELARVRVEVLKMVEEREQLLQQKELFEKGQHNQDTFIKQRCQNLVEKIRKKRQARLPKIEISTEDKDQVDDKTVNIDENLSKDSPATTEESDKTGCETKDEIGLLDSQVCLLEQELAHEQDVLEKEKASLLEKNNKMEQDIEILRVELDKSEDYWTLKLQEEQDYYEEERRLYDEKFSSLEKKIREYEDLVLSGNGNGKDSDESDRLSTIDESVVWEKQVTELEEEVSQLRRQVEDMKEERFNMEQGWEACVEEERQKASQECRNLQEQVNNLSTQLSQAQHQVNKVLEELEKVRKESENQMRELSSHNRINMQLSDEPQLVNGLDTEARSRLSPASPEEEKFVVQGSGSLGEETINGCLRSQLRQCQSRLRYLEVALRQHHSHAHQILTVTRKQHGAEVQNLEAMIAATQQMLGQHIAKHKDQLSKASRSDSLVRELYLENAQLMRALQITESRQKVAEETSRKLQLSALENAMM